MRQIGVVGFGSFGRFLCHHLAPHFEIAVHDRLDLEVEARSMGLGWLGLDDVVCCEIVIIAVPVQDMAPVVDAIAAASSLPTLVLDVASVKLAPMALMRERLPAGIEFAGLHPMFGPQSGADGIEGLTVVLCEGRTTRTAAIRAFLERTLSLNVLELSPREHDAEMAYVQGLTHWIAKALREIKMPDLRLATPAYRHLMRIEEILRDDSDALFRTIESANPFAAEARRELVERLAEIERQLSED